jgi:hypothetical protein
MNGILLRWVMLVAFAIGLAGCSSKPPMVSATGTVTLNGKPIENCKVCFYPENDNADPNEQGYGTAWTDSQGHYEIHNAIGEIGIFPGRYKIVLTCNAYRDGKPLPKTVKPSQVPGGCINLMPKQYDDPSTTPEIVEVPRNGLNKDFNINS